LPEYEFVADGKNDRFHGEDSAKPTPVAPAAAL
jgi:hypothetical protein